MKKQSMVQGLALVALWTLTFFTPLARAQTTFGSIEGTVKDASQGGIPKATVTLKNQATDIQRTTFTDDDGRYRFVDVQRGLYNLTIAQQGFKTSVTTDIRILGGETKAVDAVLEIGQVTETVNVPASMSPIQTATSHLSTVLTQGTVTELPVIGRDFATLPLLAPGVQTDAQGGVAQFSTNGQRSTTNTFTVDGSDINNPYWNVLQGGSLGTGTAFASLDGISELRIQTGSSSAEYGRTSGAMVTVITKSGTNNFHGDMFEFFRNDILNANDWFANQAGAEKPPLRFNNFGGTIGGPIKKNRLFFFFLYEGQRENRFGFFKATTADTSFVTANALPVMTPLLKYLPTPNGPPILDADGNPTGLASLSLSTFDNKVENDYQGRVDFQLSSRDSIFYRQTVSDGTELVNQFGFILPPYAADSNKFTLLSGTLVETHTFSQNVVNEFRFGWNRQNTPFATVNHGSNVLQFDSEGRPVDPRFSIGGTTIALYGGLGPVGQVINVFQPTDNFSIIRRKHIVKVGFDIRRTQINQSNNQTFQGSYRFRSVQNFIDDAPSSFLAVRGNVAQYPRLTSYSFYGEDDFKIRSNLTLNLGLRYELNTVISEAHGKLSNLVPLSDIANAQIVEGATYNGDHNNFAPRLGFAWDIGGHQKNVLRSAFGVYYDLGPGYWGPVDLVTNPPATFIPFLTGAEAVFPVDQTLLVPGNGLTVGVHAVPQDNRTSYTMQYNLTYQRNLPQDFALTVSYVGAEGRKLYRLRTAKLFDPATGLPNNPNFSSIIISENGSASSYNALQMTLERPFHNGSYVHAAYTYSHMIDDSCGFAFYSGAPCVTSNPFDLRAERASSATDIRHNFVTGYVYSLPLRRLLGLRSPNRLVDGWQLSGILTGRTGLPYTVLVGFDNSGYNADFFGSQRPNVVPGKPFTLGSSNGPDYRLNPDAFSIPPPLTFGNLGRDTFRAESLWVMDFGISKDTRIAEKISLQFRTEFFNIFNHPNFGVPGDTNTLTTPASSFGVADVLARRPREIQFALKLVF